MAPRNSTAEVPILIVGAGPVGLALAADLGLRRVPCLVIEQGEGPADHPRALETYRKAGFRVVRSERKELQDPRVLWPDIYRWPPK